MKIENREPLSTYLSRNYPFKVEVDPEGGFVIWFPDLPGCVTQADTPAEIGPMADEAKALWIESEYEAGEAIPEPAQRLAYSGKFNLRLPRSLHAALANAAEEDGVSLNQYVVHLLSTAQARRQPDTTPSPSPLASSRR
jgi:predicted RNase H-like HicB family nuclease